MGTRISEKFKTLEANNQKALITYVTCADPDLDTTMNLVYTMENAGADIIELGIPYSDPLADGPIIQRAALRALQNHVHLDDIFHMVTKIRQKTQIPLLLLVYYNLIFRYGIEKFIKACEDCGIDGLIIPDLPLEEREGLGLHSHEKLDLISFVAPNSKGRMNKILSKSKGFVYCISSTGVTGKRNTFSSQLPTFMKHIREHTSTPLAIGFGISDPNTIKKMKDLADAFIVGSAIVEKVEEGLEDGDIQEKVFDFVQSLKQALD